MRHLFMICVFIGQAALAQEASIALKLERIEVIPITDTQNQRQYELYVKLPESYTENEDKKYPVLYYTDALWHVELLSGSAEYLLEDVILVGISWQIGMVDSLREEGEHVSRYRDYSINPSVKPEIQAKYQLGQAKRHLEFIRKDVFSFMEENYRADAAERAYFGYSMGGLFGAYLLLAQSDTFKYYLLGSPALSGDVQSLAELKTDNAAHVNVFISYGDQETKEGIHILEFLNVLKDKKNISLHHEVIPGTHQTAFPSTGVRGVSWLAGVIGDSE